MKNLILLFIILLCACNVSNNKIINNNDFKNIISSYIINNPIKQKTFFKKKIAFPSYHIFFDKKGKDTIMAIKLFSSFTNINIINYDEQGDSIQTFTEINELGFFKFNNNLIIIFDSNNYSKNIINRKKLKKEIPDSLKFTDGKINRHIKSKTEYYKIINRNILKIK